MNTQQITSIIQNLLNALGVSFDAIEVEVNPETLNQTFVIKTKESGLLIGENGEHFYALSHLIKRMVDKDFENPQDFSIDINDYRKSLMESLKTKALMLAKRAQDMKVNVEMDPMSSYERLLVHEALKSFPGIKTESQGIGRERRVVIKYIN